MDPDMERGRPLKRRHITANSSKNIDICLHSCLCTGTQEDVNHMKKLLEKNPELVDHRTKYCTRTPLFSAVHMGHELCVSFLIKEGANMDMLPIAYQTNKNTILSYAVCVYNDTKTIAHRNIVKKLLEIGCDPNASIVPISILFYSIRNELVEIVKLLLYFGANPNGPIDFHGRKPEEYEHLSIFSYSLFPFQAKIDKFNFRIPNLLIKYGADIRIRNKFVKILITRSSRVLKNWFLFNGHIPSELNNEHENFRWKLNLCTDSQEKKIKSCVECLNVYHKFGINLWGKRSQDFSRVTQNSVEFTERLESLRQTPMTLKCLSRIAIMNRMGRNFRYDYNKLEIPIELHRFLEFPDV